MSSYGWFQMDCGLGGLGSGSGLRGLLPVPLGALDSGLHRVGIHVLQSNHIQGRLRGSLLLLQGYLVLHGQAEIASEQMVPCVGDRPDQAERGEDDKTPL